MGPSGAALAEFAWLGGSFDPNIFAKLREVLADCLERESPWIGGELAYWLFLVGELDQLPEELPAPYLLALSGKWDEAARLWEEMGIPYDRAVALSLGTNDSRIEALAIFDDLGATVPAASGRSQLVKAGVAGVPRGPSRATRDNRFGLTPRQMDVLSSLAENLTNAEIADQLFLSSRTVDHHVSAILGKLGAETRTQAVAIARKAGVLT
jgi:DNA-binding CsgD family transcriptional regulator